MFFAFGIRIPDFIMVALFRGAKSTGEVTNTQMVIRRLLEERIAQKEKTNDLLRDQKTNLLEIIQMTESTGSLGPRTGGLPDRVRDWPTWSDMACFCLLLR
jgi:hypothetical protein